MLYQRSHCAPIVVLANEAGVMPDLTLQTCLSGDPPLSEDTSYTGTATSASGAFFRGLACPVRESRTMSIQGDRETQYQNMGMSLRWTASCFGIIACPLVSRHHTII